jgi:probable phosphoglycerate mutase
MNYRKKKIYLIRHGETDHNKNKILQGGNVDISLNETGRSQSKLFYNSYKTTPFQKIYTSTLRRSFESVENFINDGIAHTTSKDLNEISFGIYDGNINCEGESSVYNKLTQEWHNGNLEAKLEGGENPLEVRSRLEKFIRFIIQEEDELILICMHGRAMRVFLCIILNYDLKDMHVFTHTNLGLYVINYTGSIFNIEQFNDTLHLQQISTSSNII